MEMNVSKGLLRMTFAHKRHAVPSQNLHMTAGFSWLRPWRINTIRKAGPVEPFHLQGFENHTLASYSWLEEIMVGQLISDRTKTPYSYSQIILSTISSQLSYFSMH